MSEKKQTSKNVLRDIEKAQKTREKLISKISELKKEISDLAKKIKENQKLYDTLYQEELQNKFH